jgi:hypothetical protein
VALSVREFIPQESGFEYIARDVLSAAPMLEKAALDYGVVPASSFWASINPWSWFLIGAWFAVLLFFVFNMAGKKTRGSL